MRTGVPTSGSVCAYPLPTYPYIAYAPIYVDYPYYTEADLTLRDFPEIAPYGTYQQDYSRNRVTPPTADEAESLLEESLEDWDQDDLRHQLLVSIVAERIEESNSDDATLPAPPVIRDLADECITYVGATPDLSSADCGSPELPIFLSGNDYPEVTAHIIKALVHRPEWLRLRYIDKGDNTGWYSKYQQTDPNLGSQNCLGTFPITACDEFPFWRTEQGGDIDPRPHLEIIDFGQNSGSGSKYGHFKDKCKLQERRTAPAQYGLGNFLVLPVAVPGVPTLGLCNGPNPTP